MPDKMNFITLEGLQAFKEESESKSNGAYASKMTISQNATTGVVTFKLYAEDNTLLDTKTLDLDTEHIIKSVSLDYTNKLLVFTMNDDTTLNCDISDLIDNLSSDIQIAIDNEATTRANEITRVEGLITTEENRAKGVENSKIDKVANATENNIALFDSNGNVKDSGKSINDVGKVATVSVGGGTPIQPDQDKNIDLPAYPTRVSLQINNVNNTSDANKPVSTAQQTAIDSTGHKIDLEIDNTTFKIKAKLYDKNNTLISTSNEIDLPLESVVVGGSYNALTKKVELTLQNGTTIEFSVADLIYGLQSEITAQNPLSSDLVDDTNNTHKFVSANEKAQITTNQNDIAGIKNGENLDSFADVEAEFETKEDKTNKVSAFQNTPDNTHYPTEKLVKDSLNTKANVLTISDSATSISNDDYTKYLLNDAKKTIIVMGEHVYVYYRDYSSYYSFIRPDMNRIEERDDRWGYDHIEIQKGSGVHSITKYYSMPDFFESNMVYIDKETQSIDSNSFDIIESNVMPVIQCELESGVYDYYYKSYTDESNYYIFKCFTEQANGESVVKQIAVSTEQDENENYPISYNEIPLSIRVVDLR